MDQKSRIDMLQIVIKGIAKVMGRNAEVALHDLEERKIVGIENAHITGRSIGFRTSDSVLKAILDSCDEEGVLVGYNTKTKQGNVLRSSHFLFFDEEKQPKALICINQDVSLMVSVRDELNMFLAPRRLEVKADGYSDEDEEKNSIQKITTQLILEEIERVKPASLDTKETKIEILRSLLEKGVFAVKDAVPQVCELLSISQATLYVYLREIRNKNGDVANGQR